MIKRGFAPSEFEARVKRAQALMQTHDISALLLTTEPDVRYFTGFLTQFWQSPTRPWFLIVPASGKPVAVIPSIGRALMGSTWIDDIRTWASPDLNDDGIGLLADTLGEVSDGGRVAIPDGHETHLRMPISDFVRLKNWIGIGSDNGIMRSLRMVKSEAEIDKIRHACAIGGQAFDAVQGFAKVGMTQSDISRAFQSACLDAGADSVPYVAMGLGQNGYHDVISPAADQVAAQGDVLMLDTGLVWDGYFCDFDRNYSFGPITPMVSNCFAKLLDATETGLQAANVGATAADVFQAMAQVTGAGKAMEAGRFGHGLGMQLTEWPSLIAADKTELVDGMVLTLEPSIETVDGRILVHEENIVVRSGGAEKLTPFATQVTEIS